MTEPRVQRDARLQWVPIPKMSVNARAQRDLRQDRVDYLVANFDPEQIGTPTVNLRGDHWYVIDGQHRVEALKAVGWGDQSVQCWTYKGLTEQEEAAKFLQLNDVLVVSALPKFRAGVTAELDEETEIDSVVRAQGLCVTRDKVEGSISAVGTLRRVYRRSGSDTLGRALRIIRDAYGDAGLEAPVIDGLGFVCQRYNGQLEDGEAVAKLGAAHGGVAGLLNRADQLRRATGNAKGQCVAAAVVETMNRAKGKGGKKLPDWWKA